MNNGLNIGQKKCPECGEISSTSLSDVCRCKEVFDFPKINIFIKGLEIGQVFNYVASDGSKQSIEIIDIDENDKSLATVRKI